MFHRRSFNLLNVNVLIVVFFLGLILGVNDKIYGQANMTEAVDTASHYELVNVLVIVEKLGSFYLDVIYTEDEKLYLNVEELFKTLKIQVISGRKGDSLGGFLGAESNTYSIDFPTGRIKVKDKTMEAPDGLIMDMGSIFLESSLFDQLFGINLTFNLRSLTIVLKSSFELPIIRLMKQEKIRSNISKLSGIQRADTTIKRQYHWLRGGTLDWSVSSYQTWGKGADIRLFAGAGMELLFGEADFTVTYYNRQVFTGDQLGYLWKWVDNDKKVFRQAQVGKAPVQSISFLNASFIGATARNSSTEVRKATGYYTLQETTLPDWVIELYINDVLVDFTRSDASGLFVFKVPVVYGFTKLTLKFYGPMGEERIEERNMNVPYTIMPRGEWDYGVAAGFVENATTDRFGRADFNYGLVRNLTVGGGLEYLSSLGSQPLIPFAKLTFQPFSKLMINGIFAYGVNAGGAASYQFMKGASVAVSYNWYAPGQKAIPFKSSEERKFNLSLPFRIKKIVAYAKFDFQQMVYETFSYNQLNTALSAYYKNLNVNSTTQINWVGSTTPYISTDLAFSLRLSGGITTRASTQFIPTSSSFNYVRAEVEKRFSNGLFSAYYERNLMYGGNSVNVTFRYDLPYARTSLSVGYNNQDVVTSESVQGGLMFGGGNGYIYTGKNPAMAKGGIAVYPFLDLNNNGRLDQGEKMINLPSLKIMGSNLKFSKKDSVIRIPDLNPFTSYFLEFSDYDLDNITWKFPKKTYSVLIDPNQFKRLEVPVVPMGEITGIAYMNYKGTLKGTGRIQIIINEKGSRKVVTTILSESDGYIYYLGLLPGEYTAQIDPAQLSALGLISDPAEHAFTIRISEDGDSVDGIEFILSKKE